MEFGSINRRKTKSSKLSQQQQQQQQQDSRDRRSFSTSNLSFTSNCSTTSIGRRSLYLNFPNKDLGLERGSDGRVLHMKKGGLAHSSGVIQIGDFVRVYDSPIVGTGEFSSQADDMITVHVTYGALEVETRPPCPLAIKIGNKSSTSLGIALGDTIGKQVKITSIQTGSLADRCGFLMPGDILTSVQISPNETIPCSPYYTSFQIAQILRKLASSKNSVTLTIVPMEEIIESSCSDNNSISVSGSTVTLRDNDRDSPSISGQIMRKKTTTSLSYGFFSNNKNNTDGNCNGGGGGSSSNSNKTFHGVKRDFNNSKIQEKDDEDEEGADCENEDECVLSLCLWKDRLYEDWGFSLIDDDDDDNGNEDSSDQDISRHEEEKQFRSSRRKSRQKTRFGAYVHQIRPGGPAFISGLRSGDRFLQINDRDVTNLESTMLVPVLASLDALNLVVVRKNTG